MSGMSEVPAGPRPHLPGEGRRTPVSTYRLQLQPEFGFAQAEQALPLLEELGITDLYLSPILQAAHGSTHGYDVVDHSVVNQSLGGRIGFESLACAAHARNIGIVVDVVPNHMAVPTPMWENKALWSVLREGPASPYTDWFDSTDGVEGLLMPVLGSRIGTVLANQELILAEETVPGESEPSPVLHYHDRVFPVRPGTESLPLAEMVQAQHYRLAYWKVADEELNYRRFFDIDTLAALRMEDRKVFDATHALLFELFDAGHIDGFRIDHPDGLANPQLYFEWLSQATDGAWVVAEKILEADETLPNNWPIAGTTGYDAAWRIGSLFVDSAATLSMTSLAQSMSEDPSTLPQVIEQSKREVATTSLYTEIHRIADLAHDICRDDIRLQDHTFRSIDACMTELVVAIDRYRAYVIPGEDVAPVDARVVRHAAELAATRIDPDYVETLDVVVDLVLGHEVGSAGRINEARRWELIIRFQQVCGAVMAKGVEDTAYYRWTPLVSLCEVGGAPQFFGTTPDDLHEWCANAAAIRPTTMTLLSSHDTKRSEDVRAKIGVISQFSDRWNTLISRIDAFAKSIEGRTRNVLWQTIVGTWDEGPITAERLSSYMIKVAREQKIWTSWTAPDTDGEEELRLACNELIHNEEVIGEFEEFMRICAPFARATILGQKALQLTVPGVADTFQGCERLQTFLVDPDNRAPLDVAVLADSLDVVKTRAPRSLSEEKLALTRGILHLRRRHPQAFVGPNADYRPIATSTEHLVAFTRGGDQRAVTVVARPGHVQLEGAGFHEHTVVLPEGHWRDVISGATFEGGSQNASDLLASMPVAVLERVDL